MCRGTLFRDRGSTVHAVAWVRRIDDVVVLQLPQEFVVTKQQFVRLVTHLCACVELADATGQPVMAVVREIVVVLVSSRGGHRETRLLGLGVGNISTVKFSTILHME